MKQTLQAMLLLLLTAASLSAQVKRTLSGTIRDAGSGETVIGASIFLPSTQSGTISNEYGFYSITLPESQDAIRVVFSYVGYQAQVKEVFFRDKDITLNVELGQGQDLDEVVVEASGIRQQLNSTQMGVAEVTSAQSKILPAFLGETDIIRTLQLKPGVLTGGEGQSGVFVRGGGPDQNLFLLDEAPVYNPSHLFGFFSTFNTDAVKSAEIYKGAFPAQYGGRLSSVIDVKLNEGNRKRFAGTGGIGLISSRLTLEGPLKKDKGSFIVSGRRTYADLITNGINEANKNDSTFNPLPAYYFYDLNAKLNWDIDEKNKVFLSGYLGRDFFKFSSRQGFNIGFDWGNITSTARWNHLFSSKLFSNTSFTFSDYNYEINNRFDQFSFKIGSGIRDYNGKIDFGWFPNQAHSVKFGANLIHHTFKVNNLSVRTDDNNLNVNGGNNFNAIDGAIYANDEWVVNKKLSLSYGLRLSTFINSGTAYFGPEPRAGAKFSLTNDISLKAGYARMYQYAHLIASSGASLPTDVWYPSNARIRPQISDQVNIGVTSALFKDKFLLSGELFYKHLQNQVDFKDNANLFTNQNLDQEFVFGQGDTYGAEIYLEKKVGRLTGWLGYTLSWSWRQFPDINGGRAFHPRYDRRHDINFVVMYQLGPRITLSGIWSFNTGQAYSLPEENVFLTGPNANVGLNSDQQLAQINLGYAPVYNSRNAYRLPDYHRMDISAVFKLNKVSSKYQSDLTVSIVNFYDRRNPFFLFFEFQDADKNGIPERIAPKVVSLFPILPTVTYNFKF